MRKNQFDQIEMKLTVFDAARDALESANGDFFNAKKIILQRAKTDRRLYDLLVEPVLGDLCAEAVRSVRVRLKDWPTDLGAKISTLNLSNCAANSLANENIGTVGELVQMSAGELSRMPNFGAISIAEIIDRLAERGLSLAPHASEPRRTVVSLRKGR